MLNSNYLVNSKPKDTNKHSKTNYSFMNKITVIWCFNYIIQHDLAFISASN